MTSMVGPYPIDSVHAVDCITGMRQMPDASVDIAIADPPYNVSKGGMWKWDGSANLPGFGGAWSKMMAEWDNLPLLDYFRFTADWIAELKRVVRPAGSIWIHGTYHNIGIINFVLQLLEVEIINEVIWYKRNSFPNLSGRRLTASHETILWCHTGKTRQYLFNYEASKEMACPGDLLRAPGKQMRTVWDIPNNKAREETRFGKHPAQKPVKLLTRMIALSAARGQICLVPFAGCGSEAVAAKQSGLHYIGFETDAKYVEICRKRLAQGLTLYTPGEIAGTETVRAIQTQGDASAAPDARASQAKPLPEMEPVRGGRREQRPPRSIPSLVKWTGSKRSQAAEIAAQMPPSYRRYFEPFLGGGALLFVAARPGSVGGDIYQPLVDMWRLVQNDPESLTVDYEQHWQALREQGPEYYYVVRSRFNAEPNARDMNFLMRTCVNGIVRFNADGEFNNSFHLSRPGMHPKRFSSVVRKWHVAVAGVQFVCQDYEATLADAADGDFAYLDPPYVGTRQRYTESLDIGRLFRVLDDLNRRGVRWALSLDGRRGDVDLACPVPPELYKKHLLIASGNSPVGRVLNGPLEMVRESLYLNY